MPPGGFWKFSRISPESIPTQIMHYINQYNTKNTQLASNRQVRAPLTWIKAFPECSSTPFLELQLVSLTDTSARVFP